MAELYLGVYKENVVEDEEHIINICEIASKRIYDICTMKIEDPKLLAAVFVKIYEGIIRTFRKKEAKYSDMKINIADRIEIGYTTTSDIEEEKQGNFAIGIKHLNCNKKMDISSDPSASPVEKAVQWVTDNIKDESGFVKEFSVDALALLKEIEVMMPSDEFIVVIFITVCEEIVNYLKIHRRDIKEFEFEINFCSCFFVTARETESGEDDIIFRPSICSKLDLKDDKGGSSEFE